MGHVFYDPYGEVYTSILPAGVTDRLFTGYRWDDTIGLYDANARFFDPQIGQFTQPDSLIPQPFNPIALNRFAYVYNSPTNYTDSNGAIIDTLLDALDLYNNVQNCLGDSDALSCYMVPMSAGFLALPFVTGGRAGGQGARLLYQADGVGIGRVLSDLDVAGYTVNGIRVGEGQPPFGSLLKRLKPAR